MLLLKTNTLNMTRSIHKLMLVSNHALERRNVSIVIWPLLLYCIEFHHYRLTTGHL